jgi:hypothetical protein
MQNAGSALMGIGRASGENRAIQAAQQAIESPLLEVSIDGARGILFNVIGGNDLSMHEINTAAETITSAADADANIIFGATISPELDGELIITVVATGFDAAYFANRSVGAMPIDSPSPLAPPAATPAPTGKPDDDLSQVDTSLDEVRDAATDFKSDTMPNIWALHDAEDEAPKTDETDGTQAKKESAREIPEPPASVPTASTPTIHRPVTFSTDADSDDADADAELEKPSFLRRLTKRHKDSDDNKTV